MLHKAWNNKGEVPYCFPRSSIKFQGHTGQNITDFDPNWAFPDYTPVAAFKSLRFALFLLAKTGCWANSRVLSRRYKTLWHSCNIIDMNKLKGRLFKTYDFLEIAKNNDNANELRLKYYQNTIEPLHVWTTVHAFFKWRTPRARWTKTFAQSEAGSMGMCVGIRHYRSKENITRNNFTGSISIGKCTEKNTNSMAWIR